MKAVFLPAASNPYQYLLANALYDLGVEVVHWRSLPSIRWLFRYAREHIILHLHWPSGLYVRGVRTPFLFCLFVVKILLAKFLGYGMVWTVHNLDQHDSRTPVLDRWVRKLLVKFCDSLIVHCGYAGEALRNRYQRDKGVYIVPHGSYLGYYPDWITRGEARSELGLGRDDFVYLFLGQIRPYKGVENLIQAFSSLDSQENALVIAGKCSDRYYRKQLEAWMEGYKTIKSFFEFVPEGRLQVFLNAADVLVIPYVKVLTSGSGVLGLSFGLPVIGPAAGCLPEMIPESAGILYDPGDEAGLSNAMKLIRGMDLERMRACARDKAATLQWTEAASRTFEVYNHYWRS